MYEDYKVLFVDDEDSIISAMRRGLVDEEYDAYFATSGKEALGVMEKEDIAVIVSDMRMPGIDGLTLLKQIKEKWPNTVRIVLSGYTQLQQVLSTINQADVFKFITKPWKLEEEFKGVICQALDFYKIVEENERNKVALRSKNIAYQNILKNIESSIANAKNKAKLIGDCANIIISYNKNNIDNLNSMLVGYQEDIWGCFVEGILGDKCECTPKKIYEGVTRAVKEKINVEDDAIKNQVKAGQTMKVVPTLIEAAISSCVIVFIDEFQKYGIEVSYSITEHNALAAFLRTSNAYDSDSVHDIDSKLQLLNSIISPSIAFCDMVFLASRTDEFIEIVLTINNNQTTDVQ